MSGRTAKVEATVEITAVEFSCPQHVTLTGRAIWPSTAWVLDARGIPEASIDVVGLQFTLSGQKPGPQVGSVALMAFTCLEELLIR